MNNGRGKTDVTNEKVKRISWEGKRLTGYEKTLIRRERSDKYEEEKNPGENICREEKFDNVEERIDLKREENIGVRIIPSGALRGYEEKDGCRK